MAFTTRRSILLGAASASLAAPAVAQGFPSRPVRLVVPYSAGGGADTTARLIAPKLQDALGQTVVIDNKPGAGGTIGDDFVAKSAPDGHTLLIGAFAHAVNPSLMARMPFRTPDDFAPVSLLVTVPELLVVTPSFAAKTVADLVAMAKAEPGKLSYGSSGNGSAQHLAAELFKMRTGTDIQHVPYKGGALAVADVAAGHVPFYFGNMSAALPQVRAGRVRARPVRARLPRKRGLIWARCRQTERISSPRMPSLRTRSSPQPPPPHQRQGLQRLQQRVRNQIQPLVDSACAVRARHPPRAPPPPPRVRARRGTGSLGVASLNVSVFKS